MTSGTNYAIIGNSFPVETFEALRVASAAAKVAGRGRRRASRGTRTWSPMTPDAIILPKQLAV